jgi:hypothetical protein
VGESTKCMCMLKGPRLSAARQSCSRLSLSRESPANRVAPAFAGDMAAALMETANATGHSRLGTPRTVFVWGNDREHSAVAVRSHGASANSMA